MNDMDKLTLECFVNKQVYKKYLAKTNPLLLEENQSFYDTLNLHKTSILNMIQDMIENPYHEKYTHSSRDAFEQLMKLLVYQIELELNPKQHAIYDEEQDDDMLIEVPDEKLPRPSTIEYWKKQKVHKYY
jgi:uncharacterized Fe-S cluster-containing radical SAM superfamily protein